VRGSARQCAPVQAIGYTFGDTFSGVQWTSVALQPGRARLAVSPDWTRSEARPDHLVALRESVKLVYRDLAISGHWRSSPLGLSVGVRRPHEGVLSAWARWNPLRHGRENLVGAETAIGRGSHGGQELGKGAAASLLCLLFQRP
jgi:hypothetical protein